MENKRLTEKDGEFYKLKPENDIYGWENGIRLVQIVGRYEDLKEQLGCPLEVIIKALRNGIYVNTRLKDRPIENIFADLHYDKDLGFGLVYLSYFYKTKDYKKTWWLREDKSE